MRHGSSVVIIPPYLHERFVAFIIFILIQDGKFARRGDNDAFVAAGMPLDGICREDFVGARVGFEKEFSAMESVDEEGGTTCAVSMGEEMEHLKPRGVGEVCIIGMGWKCEASVGGILHCEIRGEVVKAALRDFNNVLSLRSDTELTIMSNSDECDALQQFLCLLRRYGTAVYEAESVLSLFCHQ